MGLRSLIERKIKQSRFSLIEKELDRISKLPRFTISTSNIFEKPFVFHDSGSFIDTYKEIFDHKIYNFKPSPNKNIIIDCGANMGLSTIYFAQKYPKHTIYAFEPDQKIFYILKENISTLGLTNIKLFENAVWNKEELLSFFTDNGMGGRVNEDYAGQKPTEIKALRLYDFLSDKVDFLKIDIEGAEDIVIRDCETKLPNIGSIFFEYHNDINKPQTLHELLEIIKKSGFHYYIKESGVRKSPFNDTFLICERFDMAINVFCYRD